MALGAPASVTLREQLEMQIPGPHPEPTESETLEVEHSNLVLMNSPAWKPVVWVIAMTQLYLRLES